MNRGVGPEEKIDPKIFPSKFLNGERTEVAAAHISAIRKKAKNIETFETDINKLCHVIG